MSLLLPPERANFAAGGPQDPRFRGIHTSEQSRREKRDERASVRSEVGERKWDVGEKGDIIKQPEKRNWKAEVSGYVTVETRKSVEGKTGRVYSGANVGW